MRLKTFALGVPVLLLAFAGVAYASLATGSYKGTGVCVTVNTQMPNINSLDVYEVLAHGRGVQGYTSDVLQAVAPGAFLQEHRLETGMDLNGDGSFTICNPDFIEKGRSYVWEARGQ